jgi:tetratricopeptide (TPR) repeat protein
MRFALSILARIFPPAFVLFLFVDMLMNPLVPRLGTVSAGADPNSLTIEESRALLDQSHKLVQAGKDHEALVPALKLYSVYPENYLYSKTLAEIYQRLGQYKEETEYWEKFLQYAPLPLEGCPDAAQAYWNQNLRDKAVQTFERCLAFDPEMSDSIFFLAHALEMNGKGARAGALYQKALARDPKNMDCRIGLARVEMRDGRVAQSKKRILNALQESPENVDALLVAGLVYWRMGDDAQAKQYLTKGEALSKRYADYPLILGRIEESEGHVSDALMHYNRVLEIEPDNAEAARRGGALARRVR